VKAKLAEYQAMVENLIRFAGLEPEQCYNAEQGCWQFTKGAADILVYVLDIGGEYYVNIASPIMAAPRANREELFRRLLEENGQRIAVKFSLRDELVWLEVNREMTGLGFDELKRSLVRVAEVADELTGPLTVAFGESGDA
jgi:hypothetical protein